MSATYLLTEQATLTLAAGRYRQFVRSTASGIIGTPLPDSVAPEPLGIAKATHLVLSLDRSVLAGGSCQRQRDGVTGVYYDMALVRIPAALRDFTGGQAEMPVSGATVAIALHSLSSAFPELRRHLYTEQGELRSYVNVFVNEDDVRTLAGLQTNVSEHDTLMIVPSIAGG